VFVLNSGYTGVGIAGVANHKASFERSPFAMCKPTDEATWDRATIRVGTDTFIANVLVISAKEVIFSLLFVC